MIVCHCHGVTDREIRSLLQHGARTCADVTAACGAGAGCGGCSSLVAEIVGGERHLTVVRNEVNTAPRPCLAAHAAERTRQTA